MRNNNIIVVKCFISSFAGERIHQGVRGRVEPGTGGAPGSPGEPRLNSAINRAAPVPSGWTSELETPGAG